MCRVPASSPMSIRNRSCSDSSRSAARSAKIRCPQLPSLSMKRSLIGFAVVLTCALFFSFRILHSSTEKNGRLGLPSSKLLLEPVPGNPQKTNSFPTAMALSPDGKYLALLNDGYGTCESNYSQSIAVLDIAKSRSEEHTSELQSRRDLVCRL